MGTGKTLAAQMVIEKSGVDLVWWVGPKTSLPNIKREFKLWGFPFDRIQVEFFTYEGLVRVMDEWDGSQTVAAGLRWRTNRAGARTHTSQRSQSLPEARGPDPREVRLRGLRDRNVRHAVAQDAVRLVEPVRDRLAGLPQGRQPKAMEERLAFMVEQQFDAGEFKKRIGWKDDETKCAKCGETS